MQLEQLQALVAVLEHGSFLAAARALGRRRGTLKVQVEALEAELGHELLVRSASGAEPTRRGEVLGRHARKVLDEAEALRAIASDGCVVDELHVALQPGMPPSVYVLGVQLLRSMMPEVRLDFVVCSPDEAIEDRNVDLIFLFRDELPRGAFRTLVLARTPIRLLASPQYLDARGRPTCVAALADHDLLTWTGYRADRARYWPLRDGGSLSISPIIVGNDTHILRALANAGVGIALVADSPSVGSMLESELLEPVLEAWVGEEAPARLLIPERSTKLPAVRALVALGRDVVGDSAGSWPV